MSVTVTLLLNGEPMRYTDLVRLVHESPPCEFDIAEGLPWEMARPLAEWCRARHVHVEELPRASRA